VATNEASTPASWVGRLIDRRFPLFEWLGSAESGEIFRTELPGPQTQKAAIRLVPAEIEGAQVQFDDWAQAEGLSHPNLLRIFESGRGRIDENEFLYVVMELPDETLAQVLPARALTAAEANDLLPPILSALTYLHAKGLVHGHVTPLNVLVVGDRVKLSADMLQQAGRQRRVQGGLRVYDAPEIAQGALSAASDVWSLGVTLVEALTQLPPIWNAAAGGDPGVPKFMPEPFAEIARRALRVNPEERASLAELEALFRTPAARVPSTPAAPPLAAPPSPPRPARSTGSPVSAGPAVSGPVASGTAAAGTASPAGASSAAAPRADSAETGAKGAQAAFAFDDVQPSRRALRSVEDEGDGRRFRPSTPLIVGIVAVVAVLILALVVRSHKAPANQANETQAAAPTPAASSAGSQAGGPAPQARPAAHGPSKGAVADRVMPDVPERAGRTIRGKIDVKIRVTVDHTGAVQNAAIEPPEHSRYFANLALQAARKWRFKPAHLDGRPAPSVWNLRFTFRRGKSEVSAVELTP
jgi:TonB family protein